MNMQAKYYVYEWIRPDYNVAFNVGKGKGRRAWSMHNRNKHCRDVVNYLNKNGLNYEVRIIARFINEQSAYDYEEERIAFFGLENLTNELPGGRNGGGGMTGKKHKPETIERMCASQKGKVISLEARRKLKLANLGKKHSLESCAKMSASKLGKPTAKRGKKSSSETKQKMSLITTGSGNPRATINEDIAKQIYTEHGVYARIAEKYGVTTLVVRNIKRKATWKHIHQVEEII